MDPASTRKATQRDVQRQMFIGSLHRAMDEMESRRSRILDRAQSYLDNGCSEDEVIDMLTLDGMPAAESRRQVSAAMKASTRKGAAPAEGTKWDFLWEDANGRLWRGSEFGQTVTASSKDEAMKQAEAIVVRSADSLEVVLNVEPVR